MIAGFVRALLVVGLAFSGVAKADEIARTLKPLSTYGPYSARYDDTRLSQPIPIQLVRGVHPVVDVIVNGNKHMKMLLDTGASVIFLPPEGGNSTVPLESICFSNGLCFENMAAEAIPSAYTLPDDGAYNGLIGFNVLSALPVTIDYAAKQLVFGQKPPQGAIVIPYDFRQNDLRPHGTAKIAGVDLGHILIDTGASFTRIKPKTEKQLGDALVPAGTEIAFSIRDQKLSHLYTAPSVCWSNKVCIDDGLVQVGSWQAIGSTFLNRFRVSIDGAARNFYLEPYKNVPDYPNMRRKWGFQIHLIDASNIVTVMSDSIADRAGITTDDKLVAVEGQLIREVGYLGAHALFEQEGLGRVTIDLTRNGKLRRVELRIP